MFHRNGFEHALGHANQKTGFNCSPPPLLSVIWKKIKKIGKNRFPCSKPYEMDNYVKRNISKLAPPSHPPYLYSDYQNSAVLVLVTWDQKGNEPNLLETVL